MTRHAARTLARQAASLLLRKERAWLEPYASEVPRGAELLRTDRDRRLFVEEVGALIDRLALGK